MVAQKTLEEIAQSPGNVRLDELLDVLREAGWSVHAGTKHAYVAARGDRTITIPRHDRVVKRAYVRLVVKLLRGEE